MVISTYIHACMHSCMHTYIYIHACMHTYRHYITLHCIALHCITLHYIHTYVWLHIYIYDGICIVSYLYVYYVIVFCL